MNREEARAALEQLVEYGHACYNHACADYRAASKSKRRSGQVEPFRKIAYVSEKIEGLMSALDSFETWALVDTSTKQRGSK